MTVKLLDLEKSFYIDYDKLDKEEIVDMFYKAKVTELPIIRNGSILGLVDLFTFLESDENSIRNIAFIIKDFFFLKSDDNFLNVNLTSQDIIPFVDSEHKYLGYIHKRDLENQIKVVKWKKDIEDCYSKRIQYYKDIKEEFDAIFESSYDGIHITNSAGETLRFNKACEIIDGIQRDQIIGRNMNQLVSEGIYSQSVALQVLENKTTLTILQRVNGKEIMATGTDEEYEFGIFAQTRKPKPTQVPQG